MAHWIHNHFRNSIMLPLPGCPPMRLAGNMGFATDDEDVILSAMNYGRPIGVSELEDEDDEDDESKADDTDKLSDSQSS